MIVLQTQNGCNNVYVESISFNKNILKDILSALLYWYKKYNIRYIQIKGRFGRYTYLCKKFKGLRDLERADEEVYYFDMKVVEEVLNERYSRSL